MRIRDEEANSFLEWEAGVVGSSSGKRGKPSNFLEKKITNPPKGSEESKNEVDRMHLIGYNKGVGIATRGHIGETDNFLRILLTSHFNDVDSVRRHIIVSFMRILRLREVARMTARIALEFAPEFVYRGYLGCQRCQYYASRRTGERVLDGFTLVRGESELGGKG
ncbi:hypothetical protein Tco_0222886 [Tanacetum coccineum]